MYELPTTILINDRQFAIRNKGDFRTILDCFNALNDDEMTDDYKVLASLIVFYEDFNSVHQLLEFINNDTDTFTSLTNQMYWFMNCGDSYNDNRQDNKKVMDWEQDEHILMSAINNVAHKEVRLEPYVHWWTFMGYYNAIGESTFSTIVTIRHKIASGKKLEKYEKDFKRDNPQYFVWKNKTSQQTESERLIAELWNKN